MNNFGKALDIIKNKYNGKYDARGSWDMVSFEGEDAKERCLKCHEEVKELLTIREPQISVDGNYDPYFQCRG
jgi:hypothetical protein